MFNHDELPGHHALRYLRAHLRDVPDFPKPGILFKDITPLLADPRAFHITLDLFAERFIGEHVDAVVGVESRGFIFGGALAARLNASFVPVRKPGKLPYKTDSRGLLARVRRGHAADARRLHQARLPRSSSSTTCSPPAAPPPPPPSSPPARAAWSPASPSWSSSTSSEGGRSSPRRPRGKAGVYSLVHFGGE